MRRFDEQRRVFIASAPVAQSCGVSGARPRGRPGGRWRQNSRPAWILLSPRSSPATPPSRSFPSGRRTSGAVADCSWSAAYLGREKRAFFLSASLSSSVGGGIKHSLVLRGRHLEGAVFTSADLRKVDFEGAQLQNADLRLAHLQGASFDNADLQGAEFFSAKLQGASMSSAELQGTLLSFADLTGTLLHSARLQGASLDDAELQGATLDFAQLQGASLD